MKLKTFSTTGQSTSLNGADAVFAQPFKQALLSQVIRIYMANLRQGTSKVKTRREVARTTKKWFKQKGTGNARHGARSAPIFVGGGVAHGPSGNQHYSRVAPQKMRRAALITALSAQAPHIVICDDLEKLDGKTASGHRLLKAIAPDAKKILLVVTGAQPMIRRSTQNLKEVVLVQAQTLTALEVSMADAIVMPKSALKVIETKLVKEVKAEAVAETAPKVAVAVKVKPAAVKKAPAKKKTVTKAVAKKVTPKKTK